MGHSVTLGGERVGSGNKNKLYLHNYERSTHNLSEKFTSTMGVGMLIPFMVKLATRDDKFEIDLNAGLRTIPTKGPLFGSFKLQLDVYEVPLRLYQALLHNNPLAIGLKTNQVKFPKMKLTGEANNETKLNGIMSANNSLVKYLGISGIGTPKEEIENGQSVTREMFGAGLLAYYDIFKNYYANKQEDEFYTLYSDIVPTDETTELTIDNFTHSYAGGITTEIIQDQQGNLNYWELDVTYAQSNPDHAATFVITGHTERELTEKDFQRHLFTCKYKSADGQETVTYQSLYTQQMIESYRIDGKNFVLKLKGWLRNPEDTDLLYLDYVETRQDVIIWEEDVQLATHLLKEIDDRRLDILSFHQLGESYVIEDYSDEGTVYQYALQNWQKALGGICVKTYQSDLFNNWINTEWIEGENGIAAITAISTESGAITIDALNFSEKLYNLLNRIAVSGGTYYDYLDAAYTESAKRFEETPIWVGGYSEEIVFEEIVQTAPTENSALGSLGGRGNLTGNHKGGKITVKIDEPSLIIGIASITPRIQYTQGNEFFNTEIDNLADIHVPALDGIGFQNLIGERMHASSTIIDSNGQYESRPTIGKVPAWIEYMTSVDKAYGDFAAVDGDGYMILNRDYTCIEGEIKDATTYIDPAKYNYAFAYTKRDSQNFWLQIKSEIKARRLMSARQIPNV